MLALQIQKKITPATFTSKSAFYFHIFFDKKNRIIFEAQTSIKNWSKAPPAEAIINFFLISPSFNFFKKLYLYFFWFKLIEKSHIFQFDTSTAKIKQTS